MYSKHVEKFNLFLAASDALKNVQVMTRILICFEEKDSCANENLVLTLHFQSSIKVKYNKKVNYGSGCGSVGRAVDFNT